MIFRLQPFRNISRKQMPAYLRRGVYVSQPIKKGKWCIIQVRDNFNLFCSRGKRILGVNNLEGISFSTSDCFDLVGVIDNEGKIWVDDIQSISGVGVFGNSFHFRFYKLKHFLDGIKEKSDGRIKLIDSVFVFDGVLKKMDQLDSSFSGMLLKHINGDGIIDGEYLNQIFVEKNHED